MGFSRFSRDKIGPKVQAIEASGTLDPNLDHPPRRSRRDRSLCPAGNGRARRLRPPAAPERRLDHHAAPRFRLRERHCDEGLRRECFGVGVRDVGVVALRPKPITAIGRRSTSLGHRVNRSHPVDALPRSHCRSDSPTPGRRTRRHVPQPVSQAASSAVFAMLAIVVAGMLAALASLIRRERPRKLPVVGLVGNIVLIGLFLHFRFYALGLDQDPWAPR